MVSKFSHDLHGFEDRTMGPLRALCERYSELKRKRDADEEIIRDLVRGRREDAEKIADLAEEVRELKMLVRDLAGEGRAKKFRKTHVEV